MVASWVAQDEECPMDLLDPSTLGDAATLAILGMILLLALFLLRLVFKVTAALFRLGCLFIFLILIGAALLLYMT
jgi:hypothetical protein